MASVSIAHGTVHCRFQEAGDTVALVQQRSGDGLGPQSPKMTASGPSTFEPEAHRRRPSGGSLRAERGLAARLRALRAFLCSYCSSLKALHLFCIIV